MDVDKKKDPLSQVLCATEAYTLLSTKADPGSLGGYGYEDYPV